MSRLPRPLVVLAGAVAASLAVTGLAAPVDAGGTTHRLPPGGTLDGHVIVYKDIQYKVGPDGPLALDVYVPQFGGPFPVVLEADGGGWDDDNKDDWYLEGIYSAESGLVAVIADHSLAPPGGTQHANQPAFDLLDAMTWVRANAAMYNGIPDKVGALGGSSGGELLTMIGAMGVPGSTRPDAVVSWSGVSDLTTQPDEERNGNYVGCPYIDCPDLWLAASPVTWVTSSTAPTWRGNSTDESIPIIDAYELDDVLTGAGVPHVLEILVGSLHGRAYDLRVWDANMAWLRSYIDLATGPAVTVTSGPIRPTWAGSSASFTFTSPDPQSTFTCSLDGSLAAPCASGITYTGVAIGQHVFTVWARNRQGVRGRAGTWRWNYDLGGTHQGVGGSGFSPATIGPLMGDNVIWDFSGPSEHTATDDTGLGLYDSGPQPGGAHFIYTFTNAGVYRVTDTISGRTGSVQIATVAGPLSGSISDSYLVQWASWIPPAGYVADVQVRRPGSARWQTWLGSQTAVEAWFTPDAGPGTYSFRARLRDMANGKATGWSPPASINAS